MTLGEALVVFDPASPGLLRHVDGFVKRVGGAELNVAVALARLGHRVGFAGALGDDEFGAQILGVLSGEGVAVDGVRVSEAPTGIYFKERGALGQLRVSYYRAGSAASRLRFEDLDVERLVSADVLHLTGITPALSDSCADACARLAAAAVERGTLLSVDANLRWRLLGDRDPRELLAPLVERADLLFLAVDEADALFGGHDPAVIGDALAGGLRASAIVVHDADGAWAVDAEGVTRLPAYSVAVVDTVGAGDAFVAGFLSGRLRGWDIGECLAFANACGACAVSLPGDAESMPTERDALALLQSRRGVER